MTKAATRLFQSYPKTDYDAPKEALASYVTVLSGYSEGIIRFATSVETGIQRVSKFPPRIAELVEFCDKAAARLANYERMQNWGKATLESRLLLEQSRESRPNLDELKAKHGGTLLPEDFGKEETVTAKPPPEPAVPWKEIIEHYRAHPERIENLTTELGTRKSLRVT